MQGQSSQKVVHIPIEAMPMQAQRRYTKENEQCSAASAEAAALWLAAVCRGLAALARQHG